MVRDPLLDMYLEDLGQFPILDAADEIRLGQRIQRGCKTSRQTMIQANLRLVVSVARQYEHCGLPLLDVIEEGNIGLMRAVERFDPTMECRFSTYAVHWIRQGIRRALAEKSRNVRLPTYMAELVSRWRRYGRDNPTPSDVLEYARALGLPKANLALVERVLRSAQSSGPAVDPSDIGTADGLAAEGRPEQDGPESQLFDSEEATLVRERLARVPEREAEVLRYRFGIDNYPILTLEEIGEVFSLTRERIRQIESQALDRMRGLIAADSVL
ncbi:MAG TPA: RNA polymerase subunit sigma [Planctomycetes bacterium]|nr:RNA polymerase subunit sigma [Planctomycetota bacterium]